jgi:hypothetical protein
MGTWNRVAALAGPEYLEIVAPDPAAPPPGRPRWFGLDAPGRPRLAAWIVRVPDLDAAIAGAPWDAGAPVALSRGALSWRIALRSDGALPMGGAGPLLIEWPGGPHPATRMAGTGLALSRLDIAHPDPAPLAAWCARHLADPRIALRRGPAGLAASLSGPGGRATLV